MNKTDYKPNYAVHPIEILKDFAIHQDLGSEWVQKLENNGISEQDAVLLAALYHVPKKFLLNLQKNYNEIYCCDNGTFNNKHDCQKQEDLG